MSGGIRWPGNQELADELAVRAREHGRLLLATDFDGTLAPIVATPAEAMPLRSAAEALRLLAALPEDAPVRVRVAVVTARDSDDVARRLRLGAAAVMVGNAGLERSIAGTVVYVPEVLPWLDALHAAAADLDAALRGGRVPGARLERRRCGAVLHTRGIRRPSADEEALALAGEVAGGLGLRVVCGKRTVEVRVPVDRDKAGALAALRAEAGWNGAAVVAAGDDLPDLAMLALAAGTPGGTAVIVADAETPSALMEVADAAVEGPWAWSQVLERVAARLSP